MRFKELNEKAGVDTILSTTLGHINMNERLQAWRAMNGAAATPETAAKLAQEPNPFVSKDAVERYYTILENCYEAQLDLAYRPVIEKRWSLKCAMTIRTIARSLPPHSAAAT